jgi:hypothetical protein
MGVVLADMLIVFWNMIASYQGGEFEEFNETEFNSTQTVTLLVEDTLWIDKGEYFIYEFPARRGDILNITVSVLDGGYVDFFLMEEDKKEQFEGWFNETEVKFYAYDNGKGLNISYSKLVFTSPKTDNWFIILNNYGHMKDGAFPKKEVHLFVQVLNSGFTEEQSFG